MKFFVPCDIEDRGKADKRTDRRERQPRTTTHCQTDGTHALLIPDRTCALLITYSSSKWVLDGMPTDKKEQQCTCFTRRLCLWRWHTQKRVKLVELVYHSSVVLLEVMVILVTLQLSNNVGT